MQELGEYNFASMGQVTSPTGYALPQPPWRVPFVHAAKEQRAIDEL